MAGASKKSSNKLSVYFKNERFLKRLDKIRSVSTDTLDLSDYAFKIVEQFDLHNSHHGIIFQYLISGIYEPKAKTPTTMLINRGQVMPPKNGQVYSYMWAMKQAEPKVLIALNDHTTGIELKAFINANESVIRSLLDENYPKRMKRFLTKRNIEKYLTIADIIHSTPSGSKKSAKAMDLAIKYKKEKSEIYEIAKKYKPLVG